MITAAPTVAEADADRLRGAPGDGAQPVGIRGRSQLGRSPGPWTDPRAADGWFTDAAVAGALAATAGLPL